MPPTDSAHQPPGTVPGGHPSGPDDTGIFSLLSHILVWLEEALLVTLFLSLLGLGLTQIIMRNFLDSVPPDIETILRALVLWIAMMGAAVAARRRRHIVVDLLGHYLNQRARKFIGVLANTFTAVVCLLLTFAGLKMLQLELSFDPVAMFGPIPRWVVQLPMPLAFAVMTSQFMVHALEDLYRFFRPNDNDRNGQQEISGEQNS